MPEAIVLDPVTEDIRNAPLWLQAANLVDGITLAADSGHAYPAPEAESVWVASPETEGEVRGSTRPQRRTIPITVQIVEPTQAAATNLCVNPSAVKDTTGATNTSLTLLERQTALPARLDGFDTAYHATGNAASDYVSWAVAVTSGATGVFSAWVYVVSGTVRLEAWNATPALNASSATITAGSWARVNLTFTPTTTATYTFRVNQSAAGTSEFYVTGVQIGPADPFFDGDLPGCYWTGTRANSASFRRATGGPRFSGIKSDIEDKVAQMDRRGGTYRRTLISGETITFDVLEARWVQWDEEITAEFGRFIKGHAEFTCKPYGRGAEVTA
jgi:hypothetical protein